MSLKNIETVFIGADLKVWFRKPETMIESTSQKVELQKITTELTNEEWDTKDWCVKNPNNFEIIKEYTGERINSKGNYDCICGEDTCQKLIIINHKPTHISFAVGTVCYTKFDKEKKKEIYYELKAPRCNEINCNTPLVKKEQLPDCKYQKNTNKICEGRCFKCIDFLSKKLEKDVYELEKTKRNMELEKIKYKLPENQDLLNRENNLIQMEKNFKTKQKQLTEETENIRELKYKLEKKLEQVEFQLKLQEMKNKKVYLNVSFNDKDKAKALGAKWDVEQKSWYAPNETYTELIKLFVFV